MVCKTNRLVNQQNYLIADIEKMWPISRFLIVDRLIGATLIMYIMLFTWIANDDKIV